MRIVVLDGFPIDQGQLDWNEVARFGDLALYPRTRREEVRERARGAEIVLTNKVLLMREDIEALPDLRYIGILATGTNVVDFPACRARGIAVTNVPGYAAPSVAQFVMGTILYYLDDLPSYVARVKANAWAETPDYCFFLGPRVELAQKTMVIFGLGSIGSKVAELARAFGMQVLAARVPGGTAAGRVELESALSQADFVSLHCPLTERTEKLVNRAFLERMKPGAVLINTSRGGLVDEHALADALTRDRLGGALLDVLAEEPPPRDHFLLDPNAPWAKKLVVTPHIAWGTVEARQRLISVVGQNLAAFVEGKRLHRLD